MRQALLFTLFAISALSLGCSGGGGGGGDSAEEEQGTPALEAGGGLQLSSSCGVVQEGVLLPELSGGERVTAYAADSDTLIVTRHEGEYAGMPQAVKLHGVSAAQALPAAREAGMAWIDTALAVPGYLMPAGTACDVTFAGGGLGIYGQVFTGSGENVSEKLLAQRAVLPAVDGCGAELLQSCYASLTPAVSTEVITDFLWKPVAERDGNLVVLVSPYDATIVVRGALTETLNAVGPSNGRGTTARAQHSGCEYGDNVRVEIYDASGLPVLTAGGADHIIVPSGCDRTHYTY